MKLVGQWELPPKKNEVGTVLQWQQWNINFDSRGLKLSFSSGNEVNNPASMFSPWDKLKRNRDGTNKGKLFSFENIIKPSSFISIECMCKLKHNYNQPSTWLGHGGLSRTNTDCINFINFTIMNKKPMIA